MDRKRKEYKHRRSERYKDQSGYYDNGSYVPESFWQGPGIRYPSAYKAPYAKEPPFGVFKSSISNTSTDSDLRSPSRRRKYVIIAITMTAALVCVAVIGAVVAALLTSRSGNSAAPETVEKIVEKSIQGEVKLNSKTWTDAYNDKNSVEYNTTANEFIQMMDDKLRNSEMSDKYDRTVVDNIRRGSVVVEFRLILKISVVVKVDDGNPTTTTQAAVGQGGFDPGPEIDIEIDLGTFSDIIDDIPDLEAPTISDVNECESNPCKNGGTCIDGVSRFECVCIGFTGDTCEVGFDECSSTPCQYNGICNDQINGYTCTCVAGTEGDNCETNKDECQSDPCQNGATCTDAINDYTCDCLPGYTNKNCQTNIDECTSSPCENGGACMDGVNQYTCECEPGYIGENCETEIKECDSNPCENNGTCEDGINQYTCECRDGFKGDNCEINIDECSSNPCKNDATCTDGENRYTCSCVEGWEGEDCDIDIDDCVPDPCQNGACADAVNGYTCDCEPGWTGKDCDENIDDCQPNPCENEALCMDDVNDYTCTCKAGWTGKICSENVNDCADNSCENGATCTDAVNGYKCLCVVGWAGPNCDININDCEPSPCENGACADSVNGYTCSCEAGWTGTNCDENINECESNPCEHGGTCTDEVNGYTCDCEDGFTGDNCKININECESGPCINDGTCIDDVNGYTCDCADGWEGPQCEINTDDCQGNICKHGKCIDKVNEYSCLCDDGWIGEICDEDLDECVKNPCENFATCQNINGSFLCICNLGWAGQTCGININECQFVPTLCKNSATCIDNDGGFTCTCSEGWTGSVCEIAVTTTTSTTSSTSSSTTSTSSSMSASPSMSTSDSTSTIVRTEPSAEPTSEPSSKFTYETTGTPYTEPTDEPSPEPTNTHYTESSTNVPNTTETQCSAGSRYAHDVNGVILWPWDDDLNDFNSQMFNETEIMLMTWIHRITDKFGMSGIMCEVYLQQLYPANSTSTVANNETNIWFVVTMTTSTPLSHETVQIMFDYMPDIVFITMTAMYNTTTTPPTNTCSFDQFRCFSTGRCIPASWYCDYVSDCPDGSDEQFCNTTTSPPMTTTTSLCRYDQFTCPDGSCIPDYYVCDGYNDCSSSADETACGCRFDEFECSDGYCVPDSFICDGSNDCFDKTDEIGCECEIDQFTCKKFEECVNLTSRCDGKRDCTDGTDEWYNCTQQPTPPPFLIEYEVRLMDGDNDTTTELYGRVEIRRLINGEPVSVFGTICDDSWDAREAEVLCRSLNVSDPSQSFAYGQAAFGEGSGQIWLRNIHCYGDEEQLEDCRSSNWDRVHCSHQQDASVSCGINRIITTTTTPLPTTSRPTGQRADIRLVDGENCLEGRIEVFYDGQWGTLCDDHFGYSVADVVCRSLGFSGYESYYGLKFGEATGPIFLPNLYCSGNENSLLECQFDEGETAYCNHIEDQGIRCSGDPYQDCWSGPGIPSINCTFNEDTCGYNMIVVTGNTNWRWIKASVVGIVDAKNIYDGRLMIYQNPFASEMESAIMVSPMFSASSTEMKVEFYYQLHESSYRDLKFGLNEKGDDGEKEGPILWNSVYLRRDQEHQWLYECVRLSNLNESSNYSLVFTAKRGPSSRSTSALDEILVSDGSCKESLADGMCDFDRPRTCGMSVECASCDRTKREYSWIWRSNRTYSQIEKADGYFMVVNSVFGKEGDEAILSFDVPSLADKHTFQFLYYMNGQNGAKLEVQLYETDTFHSTLQTLSGNYGNKWLEKCIQLPSDIDTTSNIKIKFKATHGSGISADIAVDDVELITGECPHPVVTCEEETSQCGWITSTNQQGDPKFYWEYFGDESTDKISTNIRLVDGPSESSGHVEIYHNGEWGRVCDDDFGIEEARVVCRMLGYSTEYVDYKIKSYYGITYKRIWLDELMCDGTERNLEDCYSNGWGNHDCSEYEHAAVLCYGEAAGSGHVGFERNYFVLMDKVSQIGLWSSLSSRDFNHYAGEYRFMFDYIKSGDETIQIWYIDHALNKTKILDKITDSTEYLEQYCIDIKPEIHGNISLGLTAFKTTNSSSVKVKTSVKEFILAQGSCKESLAKRDFTFESDHMLYGYDVISSGSDENSCMLRYAWRRVLSNDNSGMDTDHTLGNETGHYMYVNPAFGEPGDISEIIFKQVTEEESKGFCSLQFHYFISDTPVDGTLSLSVNNATKELTGIPKLSIWQPGCHRLVDTCGEDPGQLNVKFEAVDIEVGVDDVILSTEPCLETNEFTVNCQFSLGQTCGYLMDPAIWSRDFDDNLTTITREPDNYLVSPMFAVSTNSCLTIGFANTGNHTSHLMIVDSVGYIVTTTEPLHVPISTNRSINFDIQSGTGLRLYFEVYNTTHYYTFEEAEFKLFYIEVSDGTCKNPVLSCDASDIECDGICVPPTMICDGTRQCNDGSDEKCECGWNTFNCSLSQECVRSSLRCDGFNDCSDGSDEADCGPSVNCSFTGSSACVYQLFNAEPSYDGLQMFSLLSYIISPEITTTGDSCLIINIVYGESTNIRISSYDGEMYTILHQRTISFVPLTISVDVAPVNNKSFVIEGQPTRALSYRNALLSNVTLYETACQEVVTTPRANTSFETTTSSYMDSKSPWSTTNGMPWEYFTTPLQTTNDDWTSRDSTSKTTSTTPAPLPDDFPELYVSGPDSVEIGTSINLSCIVNHDPKYKLILSWFNGDTEISRNDDIMVDEGQFNYKIRMSNDNGVTKYELTVHHVTDGDAQTYFICVVDVVGYFPSNILKDGIMIKTNDDGCNELADGKFEEFCKSVGYRRVVAPTVSGLQTMDQVYEKLFLLQADLEQIWYPFKEDKCNRTLKELTCGLHLTQCKPGNLTRSICREHCQEIADACMTERFTVAGISNSDLDHYCKYLPSLEDSDCTEIWLGCDVTIRLGIEGTPSSGRLRSQNHPHRSPDSSPCKFNILTSPYYLLDLTVDEIVLGGDCNTSYLQVNAERLCSSNASMYTLRTDGSVLNISLVSNSADNSGFVLSVSKVLPTSLCDIIAVDFLNRNKMYDGYETRSESCTEWMFYAAEQGLSVNLRFTDIEECLEILDKNSTVVQEVCTSGTEVRLIGESVVIVKSKSRSAGFKLIYSRVIPEGTSRNYSIESVELKEGRSDNEGKILVTLDDGRSGYICGYLNMEAANVICRSAGFGTPAVNHLTTFYSKYNDSETKEIIMYNLDCYGDAESISECFGAQWVDSCPIPYCNCFDDYSFVGVTCPESTASCNLTDNDCGYKYDRKKVSFDYNTKFGNGLYLFGFKHEVTEIVSPIFTYSDGESVTFEYSFEGIPGETLALYLRPANDDADLLVWQKSEYTIAGRFDACVELPSVYSEREIQMVFNMSMVPSVTFGNQTIGLHNVAIKQDKCPGQFPESKCSFDNMEICEIFLSQTCNNAGSGTSVWNIKNNILEGTSTYAMPNVEYAVSFTSGADMGSFLRFRYQLIGVGVTGNDLELRVDFETETDGVETIFADSYYRPYWKKTCISLPSAADVQYNVSFILRTSTSEGRIYIDDIELNSEQCPHPISCDFENGETCNYNVPPPSSYFVWELTFVSDPSYDILGYQMEATSYTNYTTEFGIPAIFSSPVAQLTTKDNQYKCLSFFYQLYYGTQGYCKLEVKVFYPETNETFITEVDTFIQYMWQEVNIKVDPDMYATAQFSFLATPIFGMMQPALAIDDIKLLTTDCIEGLQDLDQCNFSNPGLCGFETNCTVESGYIWRINLRSFITEQEGPSTDADGSMEGYYMFLDSSLGEAGHESYIWFKVDLTNEPNAFYTFSYHMTGDGTGVFKTFYRTEDSDTYSSMSVVPYEGSDVWFESDCFELPHNFRGEIYFYAIRGDSIHSDIAIDNVKITKNSCPTPSVSCDFNESRCGYTQKYSKWSLEDGYIMTTDQGELHLPLYTLNNQTFACISFEFESEDNYAVLVIKDTGSEEETYIYRVHSDRRHRGWIEYTPGDEGIRFEVPVDYLVKIDYVTVTSGACGSIACQPDEMACRWQCIPNAAKCDRKWDCTKGLDEDDCGFSVPCEFSNGTDCGYVLNSEHEKDWSVVDSHTFNYNGTETTVTGGMLIGSVLRGQRYIVSSASSTWYAVDGPSCVRFSYMATVPFLNVTIHISERDTPVHWNDPRANLTPTLWRAGQITTESGIIMVTFTMQTAYYSSPSKEDMFLAIDKIEVLNGTCESIDPPECPKAAPLQCDDGSLCYNEELACDGRNYCLSGSDESSEICPPAIGCDFEDASVCGYSISSKYNQLTWKRVAGYWYQIPPFDHTRNDESGHFLLFVNWDNDQNSYESATATSPSVTFSEDGCITFWYYLNGTATQPTALSAQILVSLNYLDSETTEFLWYDYVDRPIDTWIQGGVLVNGNQTVSVHFTAIMHETFIAWPGVVAIDDIAYAPGECVPAQECHERSFECRDTGVCIPDTFICDGKHDCGDNSDEQNCESRPDGGLQLVGGDGTYGQLRYFLDGKWRAVCFPETDIEFYKFMVPKWVCEQLGFIGNSGSFEYKLLGSTTDAIGLSCNDSSCSQNGPRCPAFRPVYAGIKCSKKACFSGEKLCPGTVETCVPAARFCDGLPDCPNNSDEKECYCKEGDSRCTRTPDECKDSECEKCSSIMDMFECQNHQCINANRICDGNKDCSDGTDEYKCVQIKDNEVTIYYESERLPVCYNNIGRKEAETLCSLSGRGLLANRGIQRGYTKVTNGMILTESSSTGVFLLGMEFDQKTSCYPLILNCGLPECGTTIFTDNVISPLIPHGNKAVLGEWPFQGLLRKDGGLWCGCSYIGGRWALIAAHCVRYPADYTVTFGTTVSDDLGAHGQLLSVVNISKHPEYNDWYVIAGRDVALLELAYAPNIDNYTRPICIGTEDSWQYILALGRKAECYITGFGANEFFFAQGINPDKDLAETKVNIVDRSTCKEQYIKETGRDTVSDDGICLENREPFQAACYGDSGGPFFCRNEKGRWEQFGVASYGGSGCNYFVPIIYFNLTTQKDWIESVAGIRFQDAYVP